MITARKPSDQGDSEIVRESKYDSEKADRDGRGTQEGNEREGGGVQGEDPGVGGVAPNEG
jgi:hypothetical protein